MITFLTTLYKDQTLDGDIYIESKLIGLPLDR
jgi:hypothetical protein